MAKYRTYRLFQFLIMTYLLAAFSWWTILLMQKTKDNYDLKKEILLIKDPGQLDALMIEYKKSQKMIIGEGLVFAISIIISLVLINRAFWTELKTNKKLNNFLLSVTHELKTPIASLKLINSTLATKDIPESKKLELLGTANDESRRLESLVNNILTAAQMDNGYDYNMEKLDFDELIRERAGRFNKLYPEFKIQLILDQLETQIMADKESMTKLLDNLIDNAIKYSDDSRIIEIESKTKPNSSKLQFQIRDHGIGIADSEKNKILDKFYRVGNEEIKSTKGTGLGLFIVHEICKAHNAVLSISDNDPKGSIFQIDIPI